MLYTVAKNAKTFEEYLEAINAKTIYTDWLQLMKRLYPNNLFENNNRGGLVGEKFYDELTPYQLINNEKFYPTKLPYSDFEAELDLYKQDLIDELTAEFDELQRVKDLNEILSPVKSGLMAVKELGLYPDFTNWELVKKDLVKNNLTNEIDAIVAKEAEYIAKENFKENVNKKVQRMSFGNKMIATINQLNEEKAITTPQLQALLSNADMQTIMALLQTGSLATARGAISLLDPTAIEPITQADIDLILTELDSFLGI